MVKDPKIKKIVLIGGGAAAGLGLGALVVHLVYN